MEQNTAVANSTRADCHHPIFSLLSLTMKSLLILPLLAAAALLTTTASLHAEKTSLFNGKDFDGWEGDTEKTWRIQDGALTAGRLEENAPRNEFLATRKDYHNFDLTLKFKIVGTEGFVNSGVQFRSARIDNPSYEMSGYQADIGDPSWWGSLYDESRRNKVLAPSDMTKVAPVLKKGDWNEYRVRCEGPHIQLWINGVKTVDYVEPDEKIAAQGGKIAVQIHGGGKTVVQFKDIEIEELPEAK